MRKYNSLFFSVLLLLFACKKVKVPETIIQPDHMTKLLVEVHILDGTMYNIMQVPDSLYKYGTAKYVVLFKKFHTDSVQFKKSLQYYSLNPALLENIYDKVSADIKQKSDSINKENQLQMQKESKRRADSLKKLPKPSQPAQVPATNVPANKKIPK